MSREGLYRLEARENLCRRIQELLNQLSSAGYLPIGGELLDLSKKASESLEEAVEAAAQGQLAHGRLLQKLEFYLWASGIVIGVAGALVGILLTVLL